MPIKKLACLGDFHIPHQSRPATSIAYQFIGDSQPDYILLVGDFMDCWAISQFRRYPAIDKNLFENEIRMAREELAEIRRICPNAIIIYIEGNHEFRIRKYLMDRAPELYWMPSLRLQNILKLQKLGIQWHGLSEDKTKYSHNFYKIGYLKIGHGDMVRPEAAYTAKGLRDILGGNIITGHTHRIGFSPKTYMDGVLVAYENGCLCDLDPDYLSYPNWQNGFSYIEANEDITEFNIYQMLIQNEKLYWRGKIYVPGK